MRWSGTLYRNIELGRSQTTNGTLKRNIPLGAYHEPNLQQRLKPQLHRSTEEPSLPAELSNLRLLTEKPTPAQHAGFARVSAIIINNSRRSRAPQLPRTMLDQKRSHAPRKTRLNFYTDVIVAPHKTIRLYGEAVLRYRNLTKIVRTLLERRV